MLLLLLLRHDGLDEVDNPLLPLLLLIRIGNHPSGCRCRSCRRRRCQRVSFSLLLPHRHCCLCLVVLVLVVLVDVVLEANLPPCLRRRSRCRHSRHIPTRDASSPIPHRVTHRNAVNDGILLPCPVVVVVLVVVVVFLALVASPLGVQTSKS